MDSVPSPKKKSSKAPIPLAMAEVILYLRGLWARSGMTQRALGAKCGIHQPHLSNIFRLWSRPSLNLLRLLKVALGVEIPSDGASLDEMRAAYVANRKTWQVAPAPVRPEQTAPAVPEIVISLVRWGYQALRVAVEAVQKEAAKLVDGLIALSTGCGDETDLESFLDEVQADTTARLDGLYSAAVWTREEYEAYAPPVTEEPEPAPAPEAPAALRRAVVYSNRPAEEMVLIGKLARVGIDAVKMVVPDRRLETTLSDDIDMLVAVMPMDHSDFYAIRGRAERAGKKLVWLDSRSSSWSRTLGLA